MLNEKILQKAKIITNGVNVKITEPLKIHIHKRMNKVFERSKKLNNVEIEIKQENNITNSFEVTAILHIDKENNIVQSVKNESAYVAVNELQNHILRKVNELKN